MGSSRNRLRLDWLSTQLRRVRLGRLAAPIAAAVVGIVCGSVAVGLVGAGEEGCDRGTGSSACGDVRLAMLLVTIAVTYVLGVVLLRASGVKGAATITFFGVALTLVAVVAFSMDVVFSAWMAVMLPSLTAGCFLVGLVFTRAAEHRGHPSAPATPAIGDENSDAPQILPTYELRDTTLAATSETQPLVVSHRATDETTMLTAIEDMTAAEGGVDGSSTQEKPPPANA